MDGESAATACMANGWIVSATKKSTTPYHRIVNEALAWNLALIATSRETTFVAKHSILFVLSRVLSKMTTK
jgi:hypothetical protein